MSKNYRVLIVDDSDHVRILVSKRLRQRDFLELATASDGKEALEKVKTFRPHFIFLDAIMPEMGGMEVLRSVKTDFPDTIIVMMSSISAREDIVQFRDAGADMYLLKPFEDQKFDEVLAKALALVEIKKED